jgi:hypothetical protein
MTRFASLDDWTPDPDRPGYLRDPDRPGWLRTRDGRWWSQLDVDAGRVPVQTEVMRPAQPQRPAEEQPELIEGARRRALRRGMVQ